MDYLTFHPVVLSAGILEKKLQREVKAENAFTLLYIVSGEITVVLPDEKNLKLSSGGCCLVPAGAAFGVRGGMSKAVVVKFGNTECTPPFDRLIEISDFSETEEKLTALVDIFMSETKTSTALASAVLTEILLTLADERDEGALPLRLARKLDLYIAENQDSAISNTEIAAVFGYHPFYISQMLKKKTGLTLRAYVAKYRFRMAQNLLLNTDFPVAQIAEQTGFADASYFTKSFKKEFGLTPKEYRKNQQGGLL